MTDRQGGVSREQFGTVVAESYPAPSKALRVVNNGTTRERMKTLEFRGHRNTTQGKLKPKRVKITADDLRYIENMEGESSLIDRFPKSSNEAMEGVGFHLHLHGGCGC